MRHDKRIKPNLTFWNLNNFKKSLSIQAPVYARSRFQREFLVR